ncbi:DUF6421 family protein [Thermomonospora umbrina]|uniref:DUF4350 domain-containing protein n=1 Tax=Thermomonospora umbrina TaxID=111806 RepID=A0A3D9SG46_9ACTN|nr:DUF6421 family protein [Thermomonospora umbrina]REE94872.1 hypothetical protein DFJ69_0241 [Thermomonospora umbrina]
MRDFARVVFDEAHRESWSIRRETVAAMNPGHPADSGYLRAAALLRRRGHEIEPHVAGPLDATALAGRDVLVIAHPAEDRWERTTGVGDPVLSAEELDTVEAHVRAGGGLVVLAECEQDKYGSNLDELLGRFGVGVVNTMVTDPSAAHRDVAAWVMAEAVRDPDAPEDLLAGVRAACFYRAGALTLDPSSEDEARVLLRSSPTADPAGAPLAVAVRAGRGRVVVLADSDLFGDDSIDDHDQAVLWTNVVTWAAGEPVAAESGHESPAAAHPAWPALKEAVEELRTLQAADGSVEPARQETARALAGRIDGHVGGLAPLFPHDAAYLEAVRADLARWADGGFGVPDFLDSLNAFQPQLRREDGLEHLVLFPMYTQNGNPDRNLEAVLLRVVWPDRVAELERSRYDNPMFVPVAFTDFTSGYDTNSAVLFPETVAVREVPSGFTWGAIFCDREAARFRRVGRAAADTLRLSLPPDAARLIGGRDLARETFVMWDLIHDRTHGRGDLPFDPFMIKQRMPYWLYALEELRCDLTTYRECVGLEGEGVPHAPSVRYAILFDRLFRFPITGERVRNYDGLGGQLLFSYLHKNDVLRWTDNRLSVDWARVDAAVIDLCEEIEKLYRDSIDRPKLAHWLAAHDLISRYVEPHPASVWAKGVDALPAGGPPKAWTDAVLPDEFPLSMFYEALRRRLADVIASTKGIRE